jgi:Phage terminase, small subunit
MPDADKQRIIKQRPAAYLVVAPGAQTIWRDLLPQWLDAVEAVNYADLFSFGMLCNALNRVDLLATRVEVEGDTIITRRGEVKSNPTATNLYKAIAEANKLMKELGLTTASRLRMEARMKKDGVQSELDEFLNE